VDNPADLAAARTYAESNAYPGTHAL
jgi:hypothetical protein